MLAYYFKPKVTIFCLCTDYTKELHLCNGSLFVFCFSTCLLPLSIPTRCHWPSFLVSVTQLCTLTRTPVSYFLIIQSIHHTCFPFSHSPHSTTYLSPVCSQISESFVLYKVVHVSLCPPLVKIKFFFTLSMFLMMFFICWKIHYE